MDEKAAIAAFPRQRDPELNRIALRAHLENAFDAEYARLGNTKSILTVRTK
jgi:hypothetical protein